jgi:hypothetical protein
MKVRDVTKRIEGMAGLRLLRMEVTGSISIPRRRAALQWPAL